MVDRFTLACDFNVAAGTAEDRYTVMPSEGEWLLRRAYFVPATAVTADATDYVTLALKQGANTLASRATNLAGGSLVAGTAVALTLTQGLPLEFGAGDVLNVNIAHAGAGKIADGQVVCEFVKAHRSA